MDRLQEQGIITVGRKTYIPVLILLLYMGLTSLYGGQPHRKQSITVAFWNTENLFDTIPSSFYDDREYTPEGSYGWDSGRYTRKLRNMARVIGDMGADIVGLAEVENEAVVRGLVAALADDYNYIHRTSGDRRGIDIALIYKGDKLFPDHVRLINSGYSREFLHVKGTLLGESVGILICHLPSKANARDYREKAMNRLCTVADSLRSADRSTKLIVMGDFNCDPSERLFRRTIGRMSGGFYNRIMLYAGITGESGTAASYAYDGRWYLLDNIMLSAGAIYGEGLLYKSGGVFVRDYMIAGASNNIGMESGAGNGAKNDIEDAGGIGVIDGTDNMDGAALPAGRRGYPLRTFTSGRYTAGYSDHLPVYVVLSR